MKIKDMLKMTDIYTNVVILKRKNFVESILDGDFGKATVIAFDDVDNLLHGSLSDDVLDLEVDVVSVSILKGRPVLELCVEEEKE